MAGENQEAATAAVNDSQVSGSNTEATPAPIEVDFLAEFSNMTAPDSEVTVGDTKVEGSTPLAQPTPEAPAGTNPGEAAPAAVPPTPETPAVPTGQNPGETNPLVDAVAKLTETLGKQPQAAQPETPATPKEEQLPFDIPPYQFEVNDKLMDNLYSEDAATRKQAMATLLAANNQAVHKTLGAQMFGLMRETLKQAVPHIIAMANTTQQQGGAQRQVRDDFYGKYPTLNVPQLKPFVMQVAQEMVKEGKFQGWNEEFRDALGQRVTGMLQAAAGIAPQAQPAPTATPVPVAKPPVLVQPRVAPQPTEQPSQLAQDVMSLLDN